MIKVVHVDLYMLGTEEGVCLCTQAAFHIGPSWAQLGPNWECCLGRVENGNSHGHAECGGCTQYYEVVST